MILAVDIVLVQGHYDWSTRLELFNMIIHASELWYLFNDASWMMQWFKYIVVVHSYCNCHIILDVDIVFVQRHSDRST
jgi:hypothetical protein